MPADFKKIIKDRISVLEAKGDTAAKLTERRLARRDADLLRSVLAEAARS